MGEFSYGLRWSKRPGLIDRFCGFWRCGFLRYHIDFFSRILTSGETLPGLITHVRSPVEVREFNYREAGKRNADYRVQHGSVDQTREGQRD